MSTAKKINAIALARLQAILLALIGVCAGIIYAFGGAFYDMMTIGLNTGTYLAFLALLGMPLLFGLTGLVLGLVEAALFNLFSSYFGGLSLDIKK